MEVQSEYAESKSKLMPFQNYSFCKTEDSGYHTSFTPGSLECTELSSDYFDQSVTKRTTYIDHIQVDCHITPEVSNHPGRKYNQLKYSENSLVDTPPIKRGVKRSFPCTESTNQRNNVPTPTTFIAGKIQSLQVNERNKENALITTSNIYYTQSAKRSIRQVYSFEESSSYPHTPVKRHCKSSPCKQSARKLEFAVHGLCCVKNELQPVNKDNSGTKLIQPTLARPNQKIDILCLLHKQSAIPPLKKIFSYLTIQDISNFCSVSAKWNQLWRENNTDEKKDQLRKYVQGIRENRENNVGAILARVNSQKQNKPYDGCLKEIHNEIIDKPVNRTLSSPPRSPRSNRFRKFVKSGSLDSRMQLPCVRCSQPAKVTQETTGEQWAECSSITCSYVFCRFCNSGRHPGKSCSQYDLNAPSPSKRKKCEIVIGTKKSRDNLKRL